MWSLPDRGGRFESSVGRPHLPRPRIYLPVTVSPTTIGTRLSLSCTTPFYARPCTFSSILRILPWMHTWRGTWLHLLPFLAERVLLPSFQPSQVKLAIRCRPFLAKLLFFCNPKALPKHLKAVLEYLNMRERRARVAVAATQPMQVVARGFSARTESSTD